MSFLNLHLVSLATGRWRWEWPFSLSLSHLTKAYCFKWMAHFLEDLEWSQDHRRNAGISRGEWIQFEACVFYSVLYMWKIVPIIVFVFRHEYWHAHMDGWLLGSCSNGLLMMACIMGGPDWDAAPHSILSAACGDHHVSSSTQREEVEGVWSNVSTDDWTGTRGEISSLWFCTAAPWKWNHGPF